MRWQGRGDAWATPEGTKPWSLTVVQARAWAGGHAWRERCFPPCPAKRRPRRSGAFACFCRAEPMLGCLLQINRAWARLYRWEGRRRHPVPLLLQAVADLAQQHHFLGRGGRCCFLLARQAVDPPDHHGGGEGHDHGPHDGGEYVAV